MIERDRQCDVGIIDFPALENAPAWTVKKFGNHWFIMLPNHKLSLSPGVPAQLALRGRAEHVSGYQGERRDTPRDSVQERTLRRR